MKAKLINRRTSRKSPTWPGIQTEIFKPIGTWKYQSTKDSMTERVSHTLGNFQRTNDFVGVSMSQAYLPQPLSTVNRFRFRKFVNQTSICWQTSIWLRYWKNHCHLSSKQVIPLYLSQMMIYLDRPWKNGITSERLGHWLNTTSTLHGRLLNKASFVLRNSALSLFTQRQKTEFDIWHRCIQVISRSHVIANSKGV